MDIVTRHGLHPPNVLAALPRTTPLLTLMRPLTLSVTPSFTHWAINRPALCQGSRKGRGTSGENPNIGTAIRCQSGTTMFP